MVSYNRISLARKKELDQPDKLSAVLRRLFEYTMAHQVKLLGGLAVVLAAIGLYLGVLYFQNRSEVIAFNALNACDVEYEAQAENKNPREVYDAMHNCYRDVIKNHSGTTAAKLSRIKLAGLCYEAGNFNDALVLYQQALSDFPDDPYVRNTILNGLAYSYEANHNDDQAIKYFDMILAEKESANKDEALFNLARLYDQSGEAEKSLALYKRLFEEYPESMYNKLAGEKIASG